MSRHCSLHGCTNPIARRADGTEHETCGEFHYNILMSERAGDSLVWMDGRKRVQTCPVSGCHQKRFAGEDFCSKTHALLFMRQVFLKYSERKCKLPGCYKHVYVEMKEDGSTHIHEFCGWTHCKKFHTGCNQALFQEFSEEFLVEALKMWIFHSDPGRIKVDEDFFSKHPWEILPADVKSMYVIVKCKYQDKDCNKRNMITKEHYHWKQQGIKHTKSKTFEITVGDKKVTKRHLTYIKLGSKRKSGEEHKESPMYTMIEYRLQKVNADIDLKMKLWCIVKIAQHKGKLGQRQGHRKRSKIDGVAFSSSGLHTDVGMGRETEDEDDLQACVSFHTFCINWEDEMRNWNEKILSKDRD